MNIKGYESIDTVMERGTQALSAEAFEAAANETNALILDARHEQAFAKGFIPNSINIGIDGSFAPWVGTLIPDVQQQILVVAEEERINEVITRLARVGYDHAIGYLKGGFETWLKAGKEIDTIESIDAIELQKRKAANPDHVILDVRRKSEYDSEHLVGAENLPLDYINQNMSEIDKKKTYYVHCAGGYRSMTFVSTLRARGYINLIDIQGGFKALKESGLFTITDYVCPTTLL
jgi:rhodanese-related sulfurtransferase